MCVLLYTCKRCLAPRLLLKVSTRKPLSKLQAKNLSYNSGLNVYIVTIQQLLTRRIQGVLKG